METCTCSKEFVANSLFYTCLILFEYPILCNESKATLFFNSVDGEFSTYYIKHAIKMRVILPSKILRLSK